MTFYIAEKALISGPRHNIGGYQTYLRALHIAIFCHARSRRVVPGKIGSAHWRAPGVEREYADGSWDVTIYNPDAWESHRINPIEYEARKHTPPRHQLPMLQRTPGEHFTTKKVVKDS